MIGGQQSGPDDARRVESGGRPHVFVVRGDIRRLRVDAWLLPTDKNLSITHRWTSGELGMALRGGPDRRLADVMHFQAERIVALPWPEWSAAAPLPVLVAVPYFGSTEFEDFEPRLTAALEAGIDAAERRGPLGTRPRVATPAFGVGGGGGDSGRGSLISGILSVAQKVAADKGADIVLCLWNEVDYALAQSVRRTSWRHGSAPFAEEAMGWARGLAQRATQGTLVPFMGAGVSATAGLPTWKELIDQLAQEVLPDQENAWLKRLGPLDQANVLSKAFSEGQAVPAATELSAFLHAVIRRTTAERYGLAPALLAALPTKKAVTLNYDRLYELACGDVKPKLSILPFEPIIDGAPWLLKMHGDVEHPDSIVLTRDDYLSFGRTQGAVAGLAKALIMTEHLMFVGFGLQDDHFHDIVHDVRNARPASARGLQFGTALVLGDATAHRRVWGDDLDIIEFPGEDHVAPGRELEIFLDVIGAYASTGGGFVMDPRYASQLTDAERTLNDELGAFLGSLEGVEGTRQWEILSTALRDLGWDGQPGQVSPTTHGSAEASSYRPRSS